MIRKAIIPVAGLGTRLRPLSCVVPKAMMALVDARGRVLPVLHHILAAAAAAGVTEAAVVISPPHESMLRQYVKAAADAGLDDLPPRIEFFIQHRPEGFGHAVMMGRDFVADDPFLLLLGDHVYVSGASAAPCTAQVAQAFARQGGAAMIGVQPVDAAELPLVGVAGGEPLADGVYRCRYFVEKPSEKIARTRLETPGLADGQFLAHCGIYAFTTEIFDCLRELAAAPREAGKEIQLADAQSSLLKRHPRDYYLMRIAGRAYDTGTPAGYAATVAAFAQAGHSCKQLGEF